MSILMALVIIATAMLLPRAAIAAENLALRHQLGVLHRYARVA